MGEQTMETQKKVSLTKKDLNKAYWTFETYAQACCSYERLQAPGFFSGMRNIIDKLYDDDPEQKAEACQRHMEFYNSEFALVGPVILGASIAMEEEKANGADIDGQAISAIKTSLMGPLAGIGDSIFWGVLRVIAAGIAVGLGASGNVLAPIVFLLLFNIPSILVKYYGTFLGYKLGSEYIQKVYASGLMNILTKAASIVGLIMVGGMTASMVTFNSTYELTMKGESVLNLQNMLDQIFIGIVPLGLTLLCYYLLKKKNISITVLIIGVIILSILLSLLGIA